MIVYPTDCMGLILFITSSGVKEVLVDIKGKKRVRTKRKGIETKVYKKERVITSVHKVVRYMVDGVVQ